MNKRQDIVELQHAKRIEYSVQTYAGVRHKPLDVGAHSIKALGKVAIEYEVVAESKEMPRTRGVLKLSYRKGAVRIDPPAK